MNKKNPSYSKIIIEILGNLLVLMSVFLITFTFAPIIYGELLYRFMGPYQGPSEVYELSEPIVEEVIEEVPESENIKPIEVASSDFGILIPKIGVNAPVIPEVTTTNEVAYMNALRDGVAHAKGTSLPGEDGNIFLFAHSSLNFWQLGPYATVFNLLNKLENNDTITLVYNGNRYIYRVFDMQVVPGWDTTPFDQEYDESIVTLITCDPPGTTINRRVVKAKLIFQEKRFTAM